MMYLTEHRRDVLVNVFEGALKKASLLLNDNIGFDGRVSLEAPMAELVTPKDLARLYDVKLTRGILSGAEMNFSGPICGRALLICKSSDSDLLVRLMFQASPAELPQDLVAESKTDALCELGNVLLNACMVQFATLFGSDIRTQTPKPVLGHCGNIIHGGRSEAINRRMLYVPVILAKGNNELRIGFVLDTISVHALMICLDSFVDKDKYAAKQDRVEDQDAMSGLTQ